MDSLLCVVTSLICYTNPMRICVMYQPTRRCICVNVYLVVPLMYDVTIYSVCVCICMYIYIYIYIQSYRQLANQKTFNQLHCFSYNISYMFTKLRNVHILLQLAQYYFYISTCMMSQVDMESFYIYDTKQTHWVNSCYMLFQQDFVFLLQQLHNVTNQLIVSQLAKVITSHDSSIYLIFSVTDKYQRSEFSNISRRI